MKSLLAAVACATLVFLTCFPDLNGQTTSSGGITAVVTDSTGAAVPGADVSLKEVAKGTLHSGATDGEGRSVFAFLRPARYKLEIKKKGFATATREFDVLLGPPATLNVMLIIASRTMSITVKGERPLLQAENGDVSSTIGEKLVAEVPNPGNDLTYIAQTAPGTVMNTEGGFGKFSSMGISGISNLFTLNGMYDNIIGPSPNLSGALNLLLGQNEGQEATVVTNGYSARNCAARLRYLRWGLPRLGADS